jgi:20S proteasome alpha/beta subunit
MTIAAAFRFDGGLLLCADSQLTYGGVSKTPGQKVSAFALPHGHINMGFALAGSVSHARAGIRNILKEIVEHKASTMGDALGRLESAHERAYERVLRHPRYRDIGNGPDYWLLVSLWVRGQGAQLLATDDNTVNEVSQFECKGSGDYLFRYLLQAIYRPDLKLEQIVAGVAHALQEIKTYDPTVGFNSEFMRTDDRTGDMSSIAGYDIGHVENFGRLLKSSMYDLLYAMADLRTSEEEVSKAKQLFQNNLANLRKRYLEDKNHRRGIYNLMRLLEEPGPRRIQLEFKR